LSLPSKGKKLEKKSEKEAMSKGSGDRPKRRGKEKGLVLDGTGVSAGGKGARGLSCHNCRYARRAMKKKKVTDALALRGGQSAA